MTLLDQIAATSAAEWVAVLLAVGYVVLAAKQHWLCWLCAFISTGIYVVLFWRVTLPFQSMLNAYYMLMAVYGFWQWRGKHAVDKPLPVTSLSLFIHGVIIVGGLSLAFALAHIFAEQFNNDYLWLDASIHILSMITTLMVTHKKIENWLYWMVINSAAAWLYWQSGLLMTSLLMVFYVGFSIYGYMQWKRELASTDALSAT
ncbi:nicotinamide riboside transporter PnuC [Alteromonas sediminis]|uniref:Nicotinamide riboside transporter PnuC n=1 Tax=Alteromonas sediminis TaxID=2259342 RepID=A0A3N5YJX7_9ALTE|nr:nicotinamide riboside transporter PnuC [Alteromonas sediminis]RPJ65061.1 nicotinamide riboside transporter PnuC [Alteromonas sediminis]